MPVHTLTARDTDGRARRRQRFIAGSNAKPPLVLEPTTRTSLPSQTARPPPQQPPPHPMNSFPVQTARRPALVGGFGSFRQTFLARSYDSASNGPQTSSCLPVHAVA